MRKLASKELLEQLKKDNQEIISIVKNQYLLQSDEVLTYKASENSWSVVECIAHLNLAARHYIPEIETKLKQAQGKQAQHSLYYKPSLLGKYMVNSMLPKEDVITNKMKTFGGLHPSLNDSSVAVFNEFIAHQESLLALLEEASNYNLQKIKIQSLIRLVRFRLGDAFRFLTAHTIRHIHQANQVLKSQVAV